MPPVLGIPLRLGRPPPSTHFRPRPELAPRAKGPLLLIELELELIQSHMAQKPVLRGEVGCPCVAREVSVERGQIIEIEPLIAMNSKILYISSSSSILRVFVQLPTGRGAGGAARQARVSVRWTSPMAVPLNVAGVRFFQRRRAA